MAVDKAQRVRDLIRLATDAGAAEGEASAAALAAVRLIAKYNMTITAPYVAPPQPKPQVRPAPPPWPPEPPPKPQRPAAPNTDWANKYRPRTSHEANVWEQVMQESRKQEEERSRIWEEFSAAQRAHRDDPVYRESANDVHGHKKTNDGPKKSSQYKDPYVGAFVDVRDVGGLWHYGQRVAAVHAGILVVDLGGGFLRSVPIASAEWRHSF